MQMKRNMRKMDRRRTMALLSVSWCVMCSRISQHVWKQKPCVFPKKKACHVFLVNRWAFESNLKVWFPVTLASRCFICIPESLLLTDYKYHCSSSIPALAFVLSTNLLIISENVVFFEIFVFICTAHKKQRKSSSGGALHVAKIKEFLLHIFAHLLICK